MISRETRACFEEYAVGLIPFAVFATRTKEFWAATARYLLKRWRASEAVEPSDLVQELLLEAWRAFPRFDPARGDLAAFICYEATSKAKRWLHGQRGRRRCSRSDKAPSRHEVRFSSIPSSRRNGSKDPSDVGEWLEEILGAEQPAQELHIEFDEVRRENIEIVLAALLRPTYSEAEMRMLRAFVDCDGDLMRAAATLSDPGDAALRKMERAMLRTVARAIEVRRRERSQIAEMFDEGEDHDR